ncbi:tetratricopeptide repeat protein [Cyanobacteria bacterium 150NLHA]|uniref:tetratricopeptide repeat protein n=2 Tax=Prochlorococcaceae TaxID=2881426 RepID=UPI0007B391E3|nr:MULTISPECIES: tetratricopeptide repeat protein [Prochlorococcus]KZR68157.1 TPR repeat-containing protein YrrB [Prochlorococcus marinus str. MIT 1312]NMO84586.1 tetratricopeptide repeat protein [Prochlorococcus sp. P1344]NMP05153.1 tetratricopeptide repeat protein [Prochlorococcus sp. P1361]NMP12756.1 tetratricopeptide repeat protein [Prochlorococcus sp.P1363]
MADMATIKELSEAARHQECLQACQNALRGNPEEKFAYKYAGKSFLALGQLEKAQQYLAKAHQLDGSDPEIAKDIGNIFLNLDNEDAASQWYEKALEINNNYAPAINNLANLKMQTGDNHEAIDLFKRAIQADPKLFQAYRGAAKSHLALGDLDQAKSFADQALDINESTPGASEILGIIFQNRANPDKAIEYYQKELIINPQARNSLLNLGRLLLLKGHTAAAIEALAKASALVPSEQCSLLLAQAYQNLELFKEAIIEYKKLNINQLNNKLIPFNLGLCLLEIGDNNAAIEAFQIAVHLDETFIAALGSIGNVLEKEGRTKEAIQATHKVLELEPDNHTAHMNLGRIYKDLGNLEQALTSTLKSVELKTNNADAHMNLGWIYKELGELDEALASTLKSLDLKAHNPTALINLGIIYKGLGNHEQALAATLKSLDLKPDNPTAHMSVGLIYQELGNLDQALTSTLQSLELNPDNPTTHMNLGGIYKDLGNLDQALASTLKSLELNADNSDAHMNLGGIYKDLGNFEQALASTLKSLELNADNSDAHMNLGGIYKDLGKFEQALASTLKSLELNADNDTALMNLGGIYRDLGKLDEALASTLKSLELKPDNPYAHINLGSIYKELGQLESSQNSFKRASELKRTDLSLRLCKIGLIRDIQLDKQSIINQRREFRESIIKTLEDKSLVYKGLPINLDTFYLAYHNENDDKEILRQACDAFSRSKALKGIICKRPLNEQINKKSLAKLRIGFYFDNPQEKHSVHKLFAELVRIFTNKEAETWIITPPEKSIEQEKRLASISSRSLKLSSNITSNIKRIRDIDLDAIIYTENTASFCPYILSMSRLARVQIATWGNPVTTGSETMDYYLSSSLIEPTNGQDHYLEQLVRLNKLPTVYKMPSLDLVEKNRSKFKLPSDKDLIGIPQSLFKFHPDYDKVLEEIISRLPSAKLILIEGTNKPQTERLKARWAIEAPKTLENAIFLPRMTQQDYLCLLETVDVLLDPIYFGSGNTFYESMAVGTPLVTTAGKYMRGRIVKGGYNQMKLDDAPIAANINEYIDITVRLVKDSYLRETLKRKIKSAAQKHLFDDQEVADEIFEFIHTAVDCKRETGELLPVNWKPTKSNTP